MKGGSARPVIPYLKRTGFLGADGTPTPLYKSFRNQAEARQQRGRCESATRLCSRWLRLHTRSTTPS
jgi:hypothetical protein